MSLMPQSPCCRPVWQTGPDKNDDGCLFKNAAGLMDHRQVVAS